MARQYRNYTDNDVIEAAKQAKSIAGFLKNLGLKPAGGNYIQAKRILQKLNINTSHWTGKGWNKGQQLKNWSEYTKSVSLKPHLIKKRGHKCEDCELTEWKNENISLEIHHLDGDRTNNELDNLKLLCCNCHALTPNWRARNSKCGRKKYRRPLKPCENCGKERRSRFSLCKDCSVKRNFQKRN